MNIEAVLLGPFKKLNPQGYCKVSILCSFKSKEDKHKCHCITRGAQFTMTDKPLIVFKSPLQYFHLKK